MTTESPTTLDAQLVAALLQAYRPTDAQELEAQRQILQFVNDQPAFADRNTLGAHLTASAWITDPERSQALLLHHKKLDIWVQPGGHIEASDQSLADASFRELVEETGLVDAQLVQPGIFDLDVHWIPASGAMPAHQHLDIRFWFQSASGSAVLSDESHELAWMDPASLARVTQEISIWRMVRKTLVSA